MTFQQSSVRVSSDARGQIGTKANAVDGVPSDCPQGATQGDTGDSWGRCLSVSEIRLITTINYLYRRWNCRNLCVIPVSFLVLRCCPSCSPR